MGKILVILGCSKRKKATPTFALYFYLGQLFIFGREFARQIHADVRIISAKYGVVHPKKILKPYDQEMDIPRVKVLIQDKKLTRYLEELFSHYDRIYVVAGATYRRLLARWWDARFISLVSEGMGQSLQRMKRLVTPTHQTTLA